MDSRELEALMQSLQRNQEASKVALSLLDEIVFKIKNRPDAVLVIAELKRHLDLMGEIHKRNQQK